MDTLMLEVSNLEKQGDNTEAVRVVGAPFTKQDALQHELDSHAWMIHAFKKLLATTKAEHATILEKNSQA